MTTEAASRDFSAHSERPQSTKDEKIRRRRVEVTSYLTDLDARAIVKVRPPHHLSERISDDERFVVVCHLSELDSHFQPQIFGESQASASAISAQRRQMLRM